MKDLDTIWVVVRSINEYNQDGEYFECAFTKKPSFQDLKTTLGLDDITIGKLTRGGGRQNSEDTWYNLVEIRSGEQYKSQKI